MDESKSRWDAYQICRERGHQASGELLTSNPPMNVCMYCGAWFRYERQLVEGNVPEPPPT